MFETSAMNPTHRSSLLFLAKLLPVSVVCLSVTPSVVRAATPTSATPTIVAASATDSSSTLVASTSPTSASSVGSYVVPSNVIQAPTQVSAAASSPSSAAIAPTVTQLPATPSTVANSSLVSAASTSAVQVLSGLPAEAQTAWQQVAGRRVDSQWVITVQSLVSRYPQYIPGHLQLAKGLDSLGRRSEAIKVLEQAVALYADQADLARALVSTLSAANRPIEAAIAARQFVTSNPTSPWVTEFKQLAESNQTLAQANSQRQTRSNLVNNVVTGGLTYALTGKTTGSSLTGALTSLQGEAAIGAQMAQEKLSQVQVINDSDVSNYVNEIGQRLVRLTGRNDQQYQFYIVKDSSPTATALPGGKIFLNTGAITSTNSEAELAAIMARQVAHSALSHPVRLVNQGNVTKSVAEVVPNLLLSGRTGNNGLLGSLLGRKNNTPSVGGLGSVLGNVLGSQSNSSSMGGLGGVIGSVLGSRSNSSSVGVIGGVLGSVLGSQSNTSNLGGLGGVLGNVLGSRSGSQTNGLLGNVLNGVANQAIAGAASNAINGMFKPSYSSQMNADADQLAGRLLVAAGYTSPTSGNTARHTQIKTKVSQLLTGSSNWWSLINP